MSAAVEIVTKPTAMKLSLFLLFLTAINLQVFAQNMPGVRTPLPGEEKELLDKLEKSKPGIPQIEILLELSAYYLFLPGEEKVEMEKAMHYAREAQAACVLFKYQDGYNESQLLIGNIRVEDGQGEPAERLLDSVLLTIKMDWQNGKFANQPVSEVRALLQLGRGYICQSKLELAEKFFLDAMKLCRTKGFSVLHYIYERLTILESMKGDLNKALFYALEAVRSMEATGDRASEGSFYFNLGYVYREIGQFQKSVDYYDMAYGFYKKKPSMIILQIGSFVAEAMTKMNRARDGISQVLEKSHYYPPVNAFEKREVEYSLGTCYRVLKQYDSAEVHYKKLLKLQRQDRPVEIIAMKKRLGQLYVEWGRYALARPYLDECLASQVFEGRGLAHLYFLLYKTDSAAGNYLLAMDHLRKNKDIDEEIYQETKVRENKELEIKYETEKKDQDLKIKQASLKQANLLKDVTMGGVILLFIILGLVYNQYRIKQKNNKEISSKNLALERLLQEKEWLLKEVHHRVKNNLHTIMSLLQSQSAYLKDDALAAVQNSQHRVYAMSLIHQKLYQNDHAAKVNMQVYLSELLGYLRDSFDVKQRIQLNADIKDVELDISKAIPVGLILNEAVTNAIKYAFPGGRTGEITIAMDRIAENRIRLYIADNGIGIPDNWDQLQHNSLGLKLMKGLTGDIRGEFNIENVNGTRITLEFQEELFSYEPHNTEKETLDAQS